MTSRTRYFLIGTLLVLVASLGVGLVAYYRGVPGGLARSAGPAELRYVPADATVVAYANVHDVMNSRFRQQMLRVEPGEQGRRQFEERTGIDVDHDIDRLVACLAPGTGSHQPVGLVLASGRFDQQKIDDLMQKQGAHAETYQGTRILVHDGAAEGHTLALAFVQPGLVAVGSLPLVQSAVDLRAGRGANVTSNSELMRLVRENSQGDAWAVGQFDELRAQAHLPEGIAKQIPPITWFSVSGQVDDGLRATVRAEARDDQSAQNLRDVVKGFVALARMQSGSRADLQDLVQSIQMGGTGRDVSLSFAVPARMLDRLPQRMGHQPGGGRSPR